MEGIETVKGLNGFVNIFPSSSEFFDDDFLAILNYVIFTTVKLCMCMEIFTNFHENLFLWKQETFPARGRKVIYGIIKYSRT